MSAIAGSIPDCPKCKAAKLKQITAKKSGKKYWVCAIGREVCEAIFGDKAGKPDFAPKRKNTAKRKS